MDKTETPSETLRSQFLSVADSTKVRRSENNDGTVKHEQKRDSGECNLQTSQKTTESAKLLRSGDNDVNFKHEQPWDPVNTEIFVASSWRTRRANLEVLGNSGHIGLLGKSRKHHCLPKKRVCNKIHPKQHSPFPDPLKLTYCHEEILSGYEEDVSFF